FMSDNGGTAGVQLFNAGMRGHKGEVYEGGHRVPLFVHWPKGQLKHGADVEDLTAHIDVLPTLIDLCNIELESEIDFDGLSFKQQLYAPQSKLSERTLFVETQRTYKAKPWVKTAGMNGPWRLIDNKELYNIKNDPAQTNNIIDEYTDVVEKIRREHQHYWSKVTPSDRVPPRHIVGHHRDPETYLTPSDWYLPKVPWNHAQVATGSPAVGKWHLTITERGKYRFEVRRWPREADAAIQGIPKFQKRIDAWSANGRVPKLIYGDKMTPLPVQSIQLKVGEFSKTTKIKPTDKKVVFDLDLAQGNTEVEGIMFDDKNQIIAGAYYIYITRL
ncbi:MAG: sulfatase/phosphatase domain-containing protein, partial [Bacteroidota bacterium]